MTIVKNNLVRLFLLFIILSLIQIGFNWVTDAAISIQNAVSMQVFLFVITLVYLLGLQYLLKIKPSFFIVGFFFGMIIKMVASLIYLFPVIKDKPENTLIYILQFFALYFLYLGMEIFIVFRLRNSMNDSE